MNRIYIRNKLRNITGSVQVEIRTIYHTNQALYNGAGDNDRPNVPSGNPIGWSNAIALDASRVIN